MTRSYSIFLRILNKSLTYYWKYSDTDKKLFNETSNNLFWNVQGYKKSTSLIKRPVMKINMVNSIAVWIWSNLFFLPQIIKQRIQGLSLREKPKLNLQMLTLKKLDRVGDPP